MSREDGRLNYQTMVGSIPIPSKLEMGRTRSMFGGYNITVNGQWQSDYVGDEVYPYAGHPFWQWIFGLFGRSTYSLERGVPIYREHDMIVCGNEIYCSPRQFDELRRSFAAQR